MACPVVAVAVDGGFRLAPRAVVATLQSVLHAPRPIRFGFSPCPNDTHAFWAAVHGCVPMRGLSLQPCLADIEALNQRAVGGVDSLVMTKLSLPALARVVADYAVLPSGAALGFGCGPLVVVREDSALRDLAELDGATVAVPGLHTTALLLLRSFAPAPRACVPMRFDEVMTAVSTGRCEAGLVIHESRFTYRAHGLRELADLGVRWESATGGPLPLGVIAARRDLDAATFRGLSEVLRDSVRLARQQPQRTRAYVRAHAQELQDDVCDRHIALYVNEFTEDLGSVGRAAIDALLARGRAAGLLPDGGSVFRDDT